MDQIKESAKKGPWHAGGRWQLWGPSEEAFVFGHRVEFEVFRLTGEWLEDFEEVGARKDQFLLKTPKRWVFAKRT